jgi:two-component system CheB/CheR fusion protein
MSLRPDAWPDLPECYPCRVLVVDDQPDAANTLALLIQALGHEARALVNPLEVCEAIDAFDPHIVFLDIGMPSVDGWTLARQLRERYGSDQLRLVALTAYGEPEDHAQSRKAGFDAHIVKPAEPRLVEHILATVLPRG